MESKKREEYFIAHNNEELLVAFKEKASYILIERSFQKDFEAHTQLPLSETAQLGFNLGFRGGAGLLSEVFFQVINAFGKMSKEQKKIDSRIRTYSVKRTKDGELLLHSRHLEY